MRIKDYPSYAAYETERKRAYRARKPSPIRPFVGVDGEGGNIDGRHEYLLLRAGDHVLETGKPLTTTECLNFLSGLPLGVLYVGYYFDYDVTMILRGMRPERLRRLLDRVNRQGKWGALPLDVGPFQVDYLPHKEFRVRKHGGKWRVINDVSGFFQTSFVKAITTWQIGTDAERELIAVGKNARAAFEETQESTRNYNHLEIRLLETLMETFRSTCQDVGYVPRRWQGAGCLAEVLLSRHGIPKTRTYDVPESVWKAAQHAYYGGRFEVSKQGPLKHVYQYDINSAYPHALLQTPCLKHTEWIQTQVPSWDSLCYGTFVPHDDANYYGLPVRNRLGNISYPASGRGWYWYHEILSAVYQDFDVQECWTPISTCNCSPFGWIPELYEARLQLGKQGRGLVLKLGLNSLYGKTAQSIGGAVYANPIWASRITSLTRTALNNAIYLDGPGRDVVMLATDGIFTLNSRALDLGNGLGQWEESIHDELFIIQPGLYLTSDSMMPKTRGLPRNKVVDLAETFRAAYRDRKDVPVTLHSFLGLRQGVHYGRMDELGQWYNQTRTITWDLSTKRGPDGRPFRGSIDTESVPYSKQIGRMLDEERLSLQDQPDWADELFYRETP